MKLRRRAWIVFAVILVVMFVAVFVALCIPSIAEQKALLVAEGTPVSNVIDTLGDEFVQRQLVFRWVSLDWKSVLDSEPDYLWNYRDGSSLCVFISSEEKVILVQTRNANYARLARLWQWIYDN